MGPPTSGVGFTQGGLASASIPATNHTHLVDMDGSHQHEFTLEGSGTRNSGEHSHQVEVSGTTLEAHTSDVMPYMQLLVCRKD